MNEPQNAPTPQQVDDERYELLEQLEDWLEAPVIALGFVWLALLVVELIWGLNPFLNALVYFIWGVFVLDFALRLFLAPDKSDYLRANWLTALSLFIPALRVGRLVRLVRVLRATRSLRLVTVIGSLNRGMRALRNTMRRRGFGYVMLLTLVVNLVGAAGMFAFEQPAEVQQAGGAPGDGPPGLQTYGEALWWTAMIMTTLGSNYWPVTAEGRLLTLLLSLYAFAVFGYVTATLATYFIGRDAGSPESELQAELAALREEIRALRDIHKE